MRLVGAQYFSSSNALVVQRCLKYACLFVNPHFSPIQQINLESPERINQYNARQVEAKEYIVCFVRNYSEIRSEKLGT